MSDKNNGPADSNKIQPGFAWGTASNQQNQNVFWDTTKYKKMAEETANNCQTEVNNYHGKENSDDSYDSDDNDGIDSMTDEEIISKFGKFTQHNQIWIGKR